MSLLNRSTWFYVLGMVTLAAFVSGCAREGSTPAKGEVKYPIRVVATTGIVADMVKNIGGDKVEVFTLMGEGVDPHLYKASPGDIEKLDGADVIFYSGLHLEGKLSEILERMEKRKIVHAITAGIDESKLLKDPDGAIDPHVWFDVELWSQGIPGVQKVLSDYDPAHAEEYTSRGATYKSELATVHAEAKEKLARIPDGQRVLVTAHDAFHYFARAYGLEVRAIQGISTDTEAGLRDINELVEFIVNRGIKAVFVETIVSERNVQSLVEGCKAKNHPLSIGGELYSDALGKTGTPEGTYAGMIRHNVEVLSNSLK